MRSAVQNPLERIEVWELWGEIQSRIYENKSKVKINVINYKVLFLSKSLSSFTNFQLTLYILRRRKKEEIYILEINLDLSLILKCSSISICMVVTNGEYFQKNLKPFPLKLHWLMEKPKYSNSTTMTWIEKRKSKIASEQLIIEIEHQLLTTYIDWCNLTEI